MQQYSCHFRAVQEVYELHERIVLDDETEKVEQEDQDDDCVIDDGHIDYGLIQFLRHEYLPLSIFTLLIVVLDQVGCQDT